jgi:hypothetical protein
MSGEHRVDAGSYVGATCTIRCGSPLNRGGEKVDRFSVRFD